MIYTSGSTGEPKGVLNINKALCNRILWMKDELNFTCKNKVLQKTPFSFDVSVWEIFLPLITGATLVIAKPEGHKDPEYLRDIIIEEHITIVHFVPSMLKLFLSEKDVQVCNKFLMYVICSGEELPYDLMIEFLNKFRKVTLYNLYGPTEAAIDVTYWKCNSYYDYKIIPIGKPIYNTEVYILDNCRKIVPTGAVGELFLGGVGLSKGYWNRLELTKSKFIKSNFPDNKTLYATGDLCKFLPDGNLVYCGRSDFQVKVHGLRIEIGEIESALKTFSDIIDAVVVFKDVLVAYLVTKSGGPINQEEIRKHLKNKIPIYMIPSLYFCIEKIPLTSNGEIDRNNLRNFKVEFTNYHNKTATPKDAIELLLINIWSRVLNVTDIGVDDNFFNLGGDSIKSIQIVSLAKDHNLICSPQDIFQYPTIHELASKLKIKKYIVENNDIDLIPPFSLVSSSDLNKVPKNVENAYPLSLLQQGLVYHSKVNKDYCTYITSYRLRSRFDYALLKASINYAAKFHEILRTSFDFANFSIPMQLVHKNFNAEIFVVDLKKYSNSKQLEIIKLWIDENKKVKFNWGRAPFFQFTVHLLNEQEFQFSIVEPILDGWSVSVLASTIFWNYKNLMAGNYEITYPVVPSYDQYLKLELGSINSKECREYWMEKVKTLPCTLLPRWNLKRETPPVIIRRQENISNRISQRLRKIAKELSLPLKNVLLAAHVKVMQIITGYEKLTIGLLTNGRPEIPNSEKMVGLFLNSLPYEIDFSGSSWDELIRYTLKIEIEGMPYRRYPLSQLNSKEVFFDVLFNFINFYNYQEFNNEHFKIIDIIANDQTYFPLTIQFAENLNSDTIRLSLDYNSSEFSNNQIEQILKYYVDILYNISEDPYGDCNVIAKKINKMRVEKINLWNNTNFNSIDNYSIQKAFEQQVQLHQNKIAVKYKNKEITYKTLDENTNKVANKLMELNVKPGTLIILFCDRNDLFLTAFLGVFKSGGAYIPLSTDWPDKRILSVVEGSKSSIIITTKDLVNRLGFIKEDLAEISIITIEDMLKCKDNELKFKPKYSQKDLAYVIYTSGSTGDPKGAMVEYRGMTNHLCAKIKDLSLDENSILIETASQSFDISVWQFLACLLVGGRVIIADKEAVNDVAQLMQLIYKENVNIYETVPSFLKIMLDDLENKRLPLSYLKKLNYLIITGEAFFKKDFLRVINIYPNLKVINAYGPTECSDDVTHFIADKNTNINTNIVPIGKPIINTQIHILDKNLNQVPIGVLGEICVSGIGVGKGYLYNRKLTNKAFVYIGGKNFYKTGDLGRFLNDGNIEFVGRLDDQVKIRGYRVELGEIETILRKYKNIKDVVVIAKSNVIIAYVVLAKKIDFTEIKLYLSKFIPVYMIPTYFVQLMKLPLNINGKIDKKSLPPLNLDDLQKKNFTAARNQKEELISTICKNILGIEKIGIYENLFDLGLDSLKVMQLSSKLSLQLKNNRIDVKFILENPSIAAISQNIKYIDQKSNFTVFNKTNNNLEHLSIESRSFEELYNNGIISGFDAAAFGYIPNSLLKSTGIEKEEIINKWFGKKPVIRRIFDTRLGRIGHVVLPITESELYDDTTKLLQILTNGLDFAKKFGSKMVSLTGLLPSATNYGKLLVNKINKNMFYPVITTGHAATSTAIVLTIENLLENTNRNFSDEVLGVIGLGSIGFSALKLMLSILPHPKEIILCDLYNKNKLLEEARYEIESRYGFRGKIISTPSLLKAPLAFYQSSFILGAVNIPDIIEVEKLKPNTIIVDDSAPHCFNVEKAINRLNTKSDILFTEGGILRAPYKIKELRYIPKPHIDSNPFIKMIQYRSTDFEIMGCLFSSILTLKHKDITPIVGIADDNVHFKVDGL